MKHVACSRHFQLPDNPKLESQSAKLGQQQLGSKGKNILPHLDPMDYRAGSDQRPIRQACGVKLNHIRLLYCGSICFVENTIDIALSNFEYGLGKTTSRFALTWCDLEA